MLDMNDRQTGDAPGREQISDPPLGIEIVPGAPARLVKPLLDVDDE
jgi:hypothetical protein